MYQSLSDEIQTGTFDGLVEALGRKFAPAERIELCKAEFRTRKRARGEKLGEIAASLSRMTVKAYPNATTDLRDQLAMDRFIGALDDRDLRIRIRKGNPNSLDEAVSRAIQLEAIYEAENGHKKQPARVQAVNMNEASAEDRITTMLTRQTAVLESMVSLLSERGKNSVDKPRESKRPGPPRSNKTCWNCGRRGHFRSNCPEKEKSLSETSSGWCLGSSASQPDKDPRIRFKQKESQTGRASRCVGTQDSRRMQRD